MKDILDILDEYFVNSVNGETEAENYNLAYGLMTNFLYDMQEVTETDGFDIDDLNNVFNEAMMEKFGYKYIVGDNEEYEHADEAAEAVIQNSGKSLNYYDVLCSVEDLGCGDTTYIEGIPVTTLRNW